MKIAINRTESGFHLSHKAVMRYAELKGLTIYPIIRNLYKDIFAKNAWRDYIPGSTLIEDDEVYISYFTKPLDEGQVSSGSEGFSRSDIPRDDPILIQVLEELGAAANSRLSDIRIVEIPDGVDWIILEASEETGREYIAENHRTWGNDGA